MLSTAGDVSLCHNGLQGQSFSYRIEALENMTDSDKAELIDEHPIGELRCHAGELHEDHQQAQSRWLRGRKVQVCILHLHKVLGAVDHQQQHSQQMSVETQILPFPKQSGRRQLLKHHRIEAEKWSGVEVCYPLQLHSGQEANSL